MRKALITGITGQDGSYLAEFLLEKGYEVHGIRRRSSSLNTGRISHLMNARGGSGDIYLHHGDMTDSVSLFNVMNLVRPDEVYNLAAQSHVAVSFETPEYTANADALGTLRLLESMRQSGNEKARFYNASTSELFGISSLKAQNEQTNFHPRSPYGVAKLFGHWITINYRESYDFFACNGILFNHESPRRGELFVTRKITQGLVRVKLGLQSNIAIGNLDAIRDWGHARDYVKMMWRILQHNVPDDYVVATGVTHSVRDFIETSAQFLGFDIAWQGTGLGEVGVDTISGQTIVKVDSRYFRPAEVPFLQGDATKAREELGWTPEISFKELVQEMIESDLSLIAKSTSR